MFLRERERGERIRARANQCTSFFSFFLLCATQSKRRKREREREEQTNTPFHSLSLFLFLRVSLCERPSLSRAAALAGFRFSFVLLPKSQAQHFTHFCMQASYLGCRFKFPYSVTCFFQVLQGYHFTTLVSPYMVLFFRRFWTARNW
jgi:hypothetical protein